MKERVNGWRLLCVGGALIAAMALGCGGGGGGGAKSTAGQISGNLTKASGIQTASLSFGRRLVARAEQWLGLTSAVADGTTNCGNPTDPASSVTVDLLQNGQVVQSTTTGSDGEFSFSNLAPGDYVIQVTLPSGVISAPAIVQPGQTTTLSGELDVDCDDVDGDGDQSEPALHIEEDTEDGSNLDADETDDCGNFDGDVRDEDGSTIHESGTCGDRSDETDVDSDGDNQGDNNDNQGDNGD